MWCSTCCNVYVQFVEAEREITTKHRKEMLATSSYNKSLSITYKLKVLRLFINAKCCNNTHDIIECSVISVFHTLSLLQFP